MSNDLELRIKILNSIVENRLSEALGLLASQTELKKPSKTVRIQVFRNITVEPILALSKALEHLMAISIDWNIKPFNSLMILEEDLESFSGKKSEMVLWFDVYKQKEKSSRQLDEIYHFCRMLFRKTGRKPFVLLNGYVSTSLKTKFDQFSVTAVLPHDDASNVNDKYREELGLSLFLSPRYYSRYIVQLVWRMLGQRLCPQIKAIFVDLDGTLYDGILSEDGINEIIFNDYCKLLIDLLLEALSSGIFVFVVTKNKLETIEQLKSRKEIKELLDKCHGIIASYERKSVSIETLLKRTRQNENSCIFLDDNTAELYDVINNFPRINVMHSTFDTRKIPILRDYLNWGRSSQSTTESNLRSQDLESNVKRNAVIEKQGFLQYAHHFKMRSEVSIDKNEQKNRVVELSQRTNQFNLSQKRFDLGELNHFLSNGGSFATATIKDTLAESGIVLTMVFKVLQEISGGRVLHIEDLCISCRALGRGIETSLIVQTLNMVQNEAGNFDRLSCEFSLTSVNIPAQNWVDQFKLVEWKPGIFFLDFAKMQELSKEMRSIIC